MSHAANHGPQAGEEGSHGLPKNEADRDGLRPDTSDSGYYVAETARNERAGYIMFAIGWVEGRTLH